MSYWNGRNGKESKIPQIINAADQAPIDTQFGPVVRGTSIQAVVPNFFLIPSRKKSSPELHSVKGGISRYLSYKSQIVRHYNLIMEQIKEEKDDSFVEPETTHPSGSSDAVGLEAPTVSNPPQEKRELCHGDTEEAIKEFVDSFNAAWDRLELERHTKPAPATTSSSPLPPVAESSRSVTRLFSGATYPKRRKYPRCISCGDSACEDNVSRRPATQNTPNNGGSRNELFSKVEVLRKALE